MAFRMAVSTLLGSVGLLAGSAACCADSGFYVDVGAGQGRQHVGRSEGIVFAGAPLQPLLPLIATSVDVDGASLAWNVALGYRVNRYLSAEVSYLRYGTTEVTEHYALGVPAGAFPNPAPILTQPPVASVGVISPAQPIFPAQISLRYSSQLQGPALSLLGRWPLGSQWALFARAGVFFADEKVERPGALGDNTVKLGDDVWLGGGGVEWTFVPKWTLRLEYAQTGKVGRSIFAGKTDVRHVMMNAIYAW